MERENRSVTFDEIILEVIPLLKNGTTPKNQTVLKILEDIGQRTGDNCWTLKKKDLQLDLFGQITYNANVRCSAASVTAEKEPNKKFG